MKGKSMISYYYRWLLAVILFAGLTGLNVLWFLPSPLLTIIMKDLNLTLARGGLVMSVVCLLVALFGAVGGLLVERIGVKKCFTYGLWLMAAGAVYTYLVQSFGGLFFSRVLVGIGFGLCLPVSGVVIMAWFSEKERPYLNTINSVLPYVATVITFVFTVPLYAWLGNSWRLTIVAWGLYMALAALLWTILGRDPVAVRPPDEVEGPGTFRLFREVWKDRQVRLLSLAEACDMWSFQFLTSMLPTFFTLEAGLALGEASRLTALFPVAGIVAGLGCGVWMSRVGLRRPFTWPMHILIFVGTLAAIFGQGELRLLGIAAAGFGNAGWAPALFTMPMEFKNMNPPKVGAVYAIMLSLGFLAAFLSPWLGGRLAEQITLRYTIVIFSVSSLIAALCTFLMDETGPRGRAVETWQT